MSRKLAFVTSKDDGNVDFHVAKAAISKDVSRVYDDNSHILTDFLYPLYLIHKVVSSNYEELDNIVDRAQRELDLQSSKPLITLDPYDQAIELMVELNRCLLNILTSQSLFLLKARQLVKDQFGENSEEYQEFECLRKQLHKASVSYRFCYELRNYAQHYGIPSNKLAIDYISGEQPVLTVSIAKNKLLKGGYEWKTHGLEALNRMEDMFDLMPHIKNYRDVANKLFLQLYNSCEDKLTQFHSIVADIKEKAQAPQKVRFFFVCNFDDNDSQIDTEEIPYTFARKLENYISTFKDISTTCNK